MSKGKAKRKRSAMRAFVKHLKNLGFTNRLAVYIILFLAAGLIGGFYLAVASIKKGYTGALMCYTAVFTPIGTACSIVLARVVDKNRAENTGGNGDGITYASALSKNFVQERDDSDEPEI